MFCFRMQAGGRTIRSDITDRDRGCRVMIWPWLCAVQWGWAIHTTAGSLTGWGRREFLQSAPCSWGDCCQEPLGSGYGPEQTERDTWWGEAFSSSVHTQIFVRHEQQQGQIHFVLSAVDNLNNPLVQKDQWCISLIWITFVSVNKHTEVSHSRYKYSSENPCHPCETMGHISIISHMTQICLSSIPHRGRNQKSNIMPPWFTSSSVLRGETRSQVCTGHFIFKHWCTLHAAPTSCVTRAALCSLTWRQLAIN